MCNDIDHPIPNLTGARWITITCDEARAFLLSLNRSGGWTWARIGAALGGVSKGTASGMARGYCTPDLPLVQCLMGYVYSQAEKGVLSSSCSLREH